MSASSERIEPFRALTFNPERVGALNRVVAPPYDLIDRARQDELYARSPYNVVRLELNRDPDPYASAAATLAQWVADQVAVPAAHPAIYFYTQRFQVDGTTADSQRHDCASAARGIRQRTDPSA